MERPNAVWRVVVGIVAGIGLLTAALIVGGWFILRELALNVIVGNAEDYIPPYNSDAKPDLPPDSISYSIWGADGIPATPIASKPHFINHPALQVKVDATLIEEAGCIARFPNNEQPSLACDDGSPLARFECEVLLTSRFDVGFGLDPAYPLVAMCYYWSDAEGLYGAGTFRVGHIFEVDDNYVLVNSAAEMQGMFAPIDSPEEALSYTQLLTGLRAGYEFKPRFGKQMFLQEVIQDTHVTDMGHGYFVHPYHSPTLGCGPYITSQVDVIVDRDGTITWMGATPVYVDLHMMCLD
ncbi:MAG: hypothetical protein JXA14_04825 [Anaerolineae bacterium]|nr:hypothetical protein [Anaerolineae bacterium]